jgi:hypothetical protein
MSRFVELHLNYGTEVLIDLDDIKSVEVDNDYVTNPISQIVNVTTKNGAGYKCRYEDYKMLKHYLCNWGE